MALWDQLVLEDGTVESDDEYNLFLQFCTLGQSRSFNGLSRVVNLGTQPIARIAHKWNWVQRANSWDLEQTRLGMQLSQRQYIQDLQFYSDQRRVAFDAAFGLGINLLHKVDERIRAMNPPPEHPTPEQQAQMDLENRGEKIPLHLVPSFAKVGVMLLDIALNNKGHVLGLDEMAASLRNLGLEMGNVRSNIGE